MLGQKFEINILDKYLRDHFSRCTFRAEASAGKARQWPYFGAPEHKYRWRETLRDSSSQFRVYSVYTLVHVCTRTPSFLKPCRSPTVDHGGADTALDGNPLHPRVQL